MKPFSRGLAAGVALIACVLLLLAAVPSQTDFDGAYFKTNALPISLVGTLTNWTKLSTNVFAPLASPALTGTPTINGQSIETQLTNKVDKTIATAQTLTGTLIAPELDVVTGNFGLVMGTNGIIPGSFTVASLPTAATGKMIWVSDAITPDGAGTLAIYDGAAWMNMRYEKPQQIYADIPSYLLESLKRGWEGISIYDAARFCDLAGNTAAIDIAARSAGAGTGSANGVVANLTDKNAVYLSTGTATNGYHALLGVSSKLGNNSYILLSASVYIPDLCTDTQSYWVMFGASTSQNTYPTDAAMFLYDLYNATGDAGTGSRTNNWLCVSRTNSVSTATAVDSGVAVSSAWTTLTVLQSGTNWAKFYINGVPVVTNTVNLGANYLTPVLSIIKTAGATARLVDYDWVYQHYRYATPRSFFP